MSIKAFDSIPSLDNFTHAVINGSFEGIEVEIASQMVLSNEIQQRSFTAYAYGPYARMKELEGGTSCIFLREVLVEEWLSLKPFTKWTKTIHKDWHYTERDLVLHEPQVIGEGEEMQVIDTINLFLMPARGEILTGTFSLPRYLYSEVTESRLEPYRWIGEEEIEFSGLIPPPFQSTAYSFWNDPQGWTDAIST